MHSTRFDFSISNYRCFSREKPAAFAIGDGISAFVGKNNSGKSALLRFFFELRSLFGQLPSVPKPPTSYIGINVADTVRDRLELFNNTNDGEIQIKAIIPGTATKERPLSKQSFSLQLIRPDCNAQVLRLNDVETTRFPPLEIHDEMLMTRSPTGLVPFLDVRSFRSAMSLLTNSCYIPSFRNAIGTAGSQQYDMLVGEAFITQWIGVKDGDNLQARRTIRQVEEDVARLMSFAHFDARRTAARSSLLYTIDKHDYPMADVGSGITQLLMLLGTVALKRPDFLFIDEPELNLHPSLQLDLISTLAKYVKGNLVFATHNIGLARAAANRIYAVEQIAGGKSTVSHLEETPTLAQFLGELQYGAYSETGGRRVLLVEGSEDVLVFQQFLRKFGADHQVIVLPLGGSSLIHGDSTAHIQEVLRICPQVAAIIDSEKLSSTEQVSKKRTDFNTVVCKQLGIDCLITERKATENYFTAPSLERAFGKFVSPLEPFEKFSDRGPWHKAANWRVAMEMSMDELMQTDIGKFLQKWLNGKHKQSS